MKERKGRPATITDEQLKQLLMDYAINNHHKGKITYLALEKATGVKRHVWSRRMSSEIEKLNNSELAINGDKFEEIPLPNVLDTIEKYFGNKEELIKAFVGYNDYIQSLWSKALSQQKTEDKVIKLEKSIEELQEEIKYLKENRDYYKSEYEKLSVESTYAHKRDEKKIDNVINIDNKEKISSGDWESQFPELFK